MNNIRLKVKFWNILQTWDTDVGITKKKNQESVYINTRANTGREAFILLCKGMGDSHEESLPALWHK